MSTQENMDKAHWSASMSRRIVERVVVQADLVLRSPARLGNGDADEQTDMPLLLDAKDRRPLLQGTSLAGALRAHYRRVVGTENTALFGVSKGSDEGEQSALIVDDAYGDGKWGIEHRDGVVLDPQTRTAAPGLLYDFDVWTAGTIFKVRFELLIREGQDRVALRQALGTALRGLSDGGITLGGRKSRGLGMLLLKEARVTTYDLRTPAGLLGWLREDGSERLLVIVNGSDRVQGATPDAAFVERTKGQWDLVFDSDPSVDGRTVEAISIPAIGARVWRQSR